MMKRASALVLAVAMMTATLTGCGNKEFDGSEVVATVGETEITADVANFYARYQQMNYETYYSGFMGDDMWAGFTGEGITYEEAVKNEVLESLEILYVLNEYADEYEVSLTEDEKATIKSVAESFVSANEAEDLALISGKEEVVTEVLELVTIQQKMREKMVADVNKVVSDDEAAQKMAQYVYFTFSQTKEDGSVVEPTQEDKAAVVKKAEELLAGAKKADDFKAYVKDKGYDVSDFAFDSETTSPSMLMVQAADLLKEGEFADVVVDGSGCYVVKLVSLFDKDATEAKKDKIVSEREDALYQELCDKWTEELSVEVNEDVWETIDFQKVGVTMKDLSTEATTEE